MIKIIFELTDEFIADKANLASAAKRARDAEPEQEGSEMLSFIGASILTELIKKGETEFVVKEDELGVRGKGLLDQEAAALFALAYATSVKAETKEDN